MLAVKGYGPLRTGIAMLPTTLSLVPASIVTGIFVSRFGAYRWAIWSGWVITTLAHGVMIMWNAETSTAIWVTEQVILGVGHGLVLNAQNFATQAIALPGDEAQAAAMYAFLRSLGMALGVGFGGSVFQNIMIIKLKQLDLPTTIARNAEAYISVVWGNPRTPDTAKILTSYTYGIDGVFGLFCGIAGLAGLATLFIGKFDLNKALVTEHKLIENRLTKKLGNNLQPGSQKTLSRPPTVISSSRPGSKCGGDVKVSTAAASRPVSDDLSTTRSTVPT